MQLAQDLSQLSLLSTDTQHSLLVVILQQFPEFLVLA
jgi:hypothetical protein